MVLRRADMIASDTVATCFHFIRDLNLKILHWKQINTKNRTSYHVDKFKKKTNKFTMNSEQTRKQYEKWMPNIEKMNNNNMLKNDMKWTRGPKIENTYLNVIYFRLFERWMCFLKRCFMRKQTIGTSFGSLPHDTSKWIFEHEKKDFFTVFTV